MAEAGRRFRILSILGQGGFGAVYKAEMIGAGNFAKVVALKIMRRDVDLPPEFALRLRDEARILGMLRHRAIVGVDGLVELEPGWAVIMEYVPGVDVARVLRHADMPPLAALEVVEEVAGALHRVSTTPGPDGLPLMLVHRDIKPANIRITDEGVVKVLDFGVARAQFATREAESRSLALGTLAYMAPERFTDQDLPAGDLFALGVVLGELLSGQKLGVGVQHRGGWDAWNRAAIAKVRRRLDDDPDVPGERERDALLQLLGQMLDYDHQARITARAVERTCRALKRQLGGPGLREWAEDVVVELAGLEEESLEHDEWSGTILVDQGSGSPSPGPATSDEATSWVRTSGPAVEGPSAAVAPQPLAEPPAAPGPAQRRPSGRGRWVVAAAAVFGIGAIGVGLQGPGDPHQEPVLGVQVAPPAPTPSPVPARPVDAPPDPPVVESEPVPAKPPVRQATRPARRPVVAPDPIEEAAPEPDAEEASPPDPTPAPGHYTVAGDAMKVWLERDGVTAPPGEVAPGTWTIRALFGAQAVHAGDVTIASGQTVNLVCDGAFERCRVE